MGRQRFGGRFYYVDGCVCWFHSGLKKEATGEHDNGIKEMIYTITLNPALDKQLTVSEIRFNDVLIAEDVQLDFGGKGFNVSRMLKEVNHPFNADGLLGGQTEKTIEAGLKAQGIEVISIPVSDETRTNVSIVTPVGSKHIKVNEKGPTVSETELEQIYQYISENAGSGTLWILAGSTP